MQRRLEHEHDVDANDGALWLEVGRVGGLQRGGSVVGLVVALQTLLSRVRGRHGGTAKFGPPLGPSLRRGGGGWDGRGLMGW